MMIGRRKLILVLLCAIASFLISSNRSAVLSPAWADSLTSQSQTKPEQRGLSPEEKRGKAFYLRGESSSGQEITAMMGEIEVPATTLTCAGCHGARGEGK